MKNPSTNSTKDDFNEFTLFLKKQIEEGNSPLVVLRNGRIVPISWFTKDGSEYEYFLYENKQNNTYLIWENDGHSIHSSSLDMMELA